VGPNVLSVVSIGCESLNRRVGVSRAELRRKQVAAIRNGDEVSGDDRPGEGADDGSAAQGRVEWRRRLRKRAATATKRDHTERAAKEWK